MNKNVPELAERWFERRPDELSEQQNRVLRSAVNRELLARNVNETISQQQGVGGRMADAIARVGGSWGFIIAFLLMLVVWTTANAWLLGRDSFDPYPFIFLNLVLSMLAALQAPIIMMSQNRQATRDRLDASHDYEVNLKAEIEIIALHEKLDALREREIHALRQEVGRLIGLVQQIEDRLGAGPAPR